MSSLTEGEQVCRECGCTDTHACLTDHGRCYWIEPDLCSSCGDVQCPRCGSPRVVPKLIWTSEERGSGEPAWKGELACEDCKARGLKWDGQKVADTKERRFVERPYARHQN